MVLIPRLQPVPMPIGRRVRQLREQKGLSQSDVAKNTGLPRFYISKVENGHTVPSIETLERFASALDVPLHQLFYEGDQPTALADLASLEQLHLEPENDISFRSKLKESLRRVSRSSDDATLTFGTLAKLFSKL